MCVCVCVCVCVSVSANKIGVTMTSTVLRLRLAYFYNPQYISVCVHLFVCQCKQNGYYNDFYCSRVYVGLFHNP